VGLSREARSNRSPRGGHKETTPEQKLTKAGFQEFKTLDEAGKSMSKQVFDATRKDSGDPNYQKEFGGFIVKYGGSYWGAPMVAGTASEGGTIASVDLNDMQKSLVKGLVGAGGAAMLKGSTVVGMFHSHPSQPDLSAKDQGVAKVLSGETKLGGLKMAFQASFVWGPRSSFLGGRDPTGKLYSYYPRR